MNNQLQVFFQSAKDRFGDFGALTAYRKLVLNNLDNPTKLDIINAEWEYFCQGQREGYQCDKSRMHAFGEFISSMQTRTIVL